MKALILILMSFSTFGMENQNERRGWYFPEQAKLQVAGNIGFLSIGLGKRFFNDKWESDIFYGYVPSQVGGTAIDTYAFKNSYIYYRSRFNDSKIQFPFYIGAVLFYVDDVKVNTITRDSVQLYDYPPNSVHGMPYLGLAMQFFNNFSGKKKRASIYMEVGALDIYLEDYFSEQNDEEMEWHEIINIAFGLSFHI